MTRYKVEVTMTDGSVYILTRTVKNSNEAGGLVERAAKQGEFLAASDINSHATSSPPTSAENRSRT